MIRYLGGLALFALLLASCGENTAQERKSLLSAMTLGKANAPVKIVEYASMTCGHCAQFHLLTLPKVKKDYIDKGIVQIELREFPLDPVAAAASLTARCVAGRDKRRFFAFIDILFVRQAQWINTQDRIGELQRLAQQAGLSEKKFRACFESQKLLQGLDTNKKSGEAVGVRSTPSFLINGVLLEGNQPYDIIRQAIEDAR